MTQQIYAGYYLINSGRHAEGLKVFNEILYKDPNFHKARIGRGSAYALQSNFDGAIKEFKYVLARDKENVDAYIRYGQTLAAKGDRYAANPVYKQQAEEQRQTAVIVLGQAIHIIRRDKQTDVDSANAFLHRGIVYKAMEDYESAIIDLKEVLRRNPNQNNAYNILGQCYSAIGLCHESKKTYLKGIEKDPHNSELWSNLAQSHRNYGDYEAAEETFTKAISIGNKSGYAGRSLSRYFGGRMEGAIADLDKRQEQEGIKNHFSLGMRGTAYMSLGQFRPAIKDFNVLFTQEVGYPMIMCWYRREMIPVYQRYLDAPFADYNLDRELHPSLKDIYLKVGDPKNVNSSYKRSKHKLKESIRDVNLADITPMMIKIRRTTKCLGQAMTYKTPGFMQNIRFHRMCGLAAMNMAQTMQKYWRKPFKVGGKVSSHARVPHKFGWRDMMDIAVRWRQHCELNDPVFWIDLIENNSFQMGFALQTPIINGQMKNLKYYSYHDRCFNLMKKLVPEQQRKLSNNDKKRIQNCKSVEEMYNVIGEDFFVITPCHPRAHKKIMEGTRLTIQKQKYGHLFTIRTPGTPDRWKQFDKELTKVFNELYNNAKKKSKKNELEKCVELGLIWYFYWVNFGPLSRGTAATGGLILHATLIANGYRVTDPIPANCQIDWEAITTPTHTEFIKNVRGWLNVVPLTQDFLDIPIISEHVTSMREKVIILNDRWKKKMPNLH